MRVKHTQRETLCIVKLAELREYFEKLQKRNRKDELRESISACQKELEIKLPPLCTAITESNSKCENCSKVLDVLRQIVDSLDVSKRFAFLICCWASAKVMVVPALDGEVYIIFCRSPFMHERHLLKVANQSKIDLPIIKSLWLKLPVFGSSFVSTGLTLLKKEGIVISPKIKNDIETLGKAYEHFGFDMVITDAVEQVFAQIGELKGTLEILFASKPKRMPIFRIVFEENGSSSQGCSIPIFGLAAMGKDSKDLKSCIEESDEVKLILQTIEKLAPRGCKDERKFELNGTEEWYAKATLRSESELSKESIGTFVHLVTAGLEVGGDTACEELVKKLEKSNGHDINAFRDLLKSYRERVGQTVGVDSNRKEQFLYPRVFGDLVETLEDRSLEPVLQQAETKGVIIDVLKSLNSYPLLMPAPVGINTQELRYLLRQDLLKAERKYVSRMDEEMYGLEGDIYEFYAPQVRQIWLSLYSDFCAVFLKTLALGMIYSQQIADRLRKRAYHRYVTRTDILGRTATTLYFKEPKRKEV